MKPSEIIHNKSLQIKATYPGLSWEESDIKAIKEYLDEQHNQ